MEDEIEEKTFNDLGLDFRLVKAVSEMHWPKPTAIQSAVIPYLLKGNNVVTRARTGCGKTGAYALPLIHNLLTRRQNAIQQVTSMLVLIPSNELCQQTENAFKKIAKYCYDITILNVSAQKNTDTLRPLLHALPDIVIGTPSRILDQIAANNLSLANVCCAVVDEADLMCGFGFADDIQAIGQALTASKQTLQAVLVSATLFDDVKALRRSFHPRKTTWTRVELAEEPFLPDTNQLTQYVVMSEEKDKFLLLLALFKLRLVQGKSLIFVSSVDRCYKVKLFLQEFGIVCVVLNSLLPANCRNHAIMQFNNGRFDILLVSDERGRRAQSLTGAGTSTRRSTTTTTTGDDFDASRGIDFHQVSNVINFDFPPDAKAYVHRVGRTARGSQRGSALTFVRDKDAEKMKEVRKYLTQTSSGATAADCLLPFQFRMEEIDQLRYRVSDVIRKITKKAIRDVRLFEIKKELVNSEQLKHYFTEKKADAFALSHVKVVGNKQQEAHLAHLPDYLIPDALKGLVMKKRKKKGRSASAANTGGSQSNFGGQNFSKQANHPTRKVSSHANHIVKQKEKRKRNLRDPLKKKK